jgi:hypothetical protein
MCLQQGLRDAAGNVAQTAATRRWCRARRIDLGANGPSGIHIGEPGTLSKVGRLVGPGNGVGNVSLGALALHVLGDIQDVPGSNWSAGGIEWIHKLILKLRIEKVSVAANHCGGILERSLALKLCTSNAEGAAIVPSARCRRQAAEVALAHANAVVAGVGSACFALGIDSTSSTRSTEVSVGQWIDTLATAIYKSWVAEVYTTTSRATLSFCA